MENAVKFHIGISSNSKTGPIPVSTSSRDTCPKSCPFFNKGCYALHGPLGIHWRKVTSGERGLDWEDFLTYIKRLPKNQLWRLNQSGDIQGPSKNSNRISAKHLEQLVQANKGRKGFTYTHKKGKKDLELIKAANKNGFTVNVSCENLYEAKKLRDQGIPAVCVVNTDQKRIGRDLVVCPAQTCDNVTCSSCGICQVADRKFVVGFLPHGIQKNFVKEKAFSV